MQKYVLKPCDTIINWWDNNVLKKVGKIHVGIKMCLTPLAELKRVGKIDAFTTATLFPVD